MNYFGKRKVREGLVVGNRMDKTVLVAVEIRKVHALYGKAVRVTRKFKAHDENNACQVGDRVKIIETRPLSKEKSWRVVDIISKKEMVEIKPEQRE